jgi:photosystem II stability/assembly factor-like uncharacterized protein
MRRRARARLGLLVTAAIAVSTTTVGLLGTRADAAPSWGVQTSGTTKLLTGVSIPTTSAGWAVGDAGMILTTANGGATWTAQNSGTTVLLHAVSFVDTLHGWAVGEQGAILATTNGGTTWTTQTTPTGNVLDSVSFVNTTHGWVAGGNGTMLVTTNGGATWTAQNMNTMNGLTSVTFVDANHGWVNAGLGIILATTNGGATWTPHDTGAGAAHPLFGVSFVDANHGWVSGVGGAIIGTTDGGITWTPESSGTTANLEDVAFVDVSHGWVAGNDGVISATTDGGATWSAQSGSTGILLRFSMVDAQHGWAVGFNGTIRNFTNPTDTTIDVHTTAAVEGGSVTAVVTIVPANHLGSPTGTLTIQAGNGGPATINLVNGRAQTQIALAEEGTLPLQLSYSGDGNFGASSTTVPITVADAALNAQGPTTALVGVEGSPLAAGSPVSGVVATFTDADPAATASDYSASIDWGDGTTSAGSVSAAPSGGFQVAGSHSYGEDGTFHIKVTISDAAATTTATATASVSQPTNPVLAALDVLLELVGF